MEITVLTLPHCSFRHLSIPLPVAEIVPSTLTPHGSGQTVSHIHCLATDVAIDLSLASDGKLFHCSCRLVQGVGTWPQQGHLESLQTV